MCLIAVLDLNRFLYDLVGNLRIRHGVVINIKHDVVKAAVFWLGVGKIREPGPSVIIEPSYQLRCFTDANS